MPCKFHCKIWFKKFWLLFVAKIQSNKVIWALPFVCRFSLCKRCCANFRGCFICTTKSYEYSSQASVKIREAVPPKCPQQNIVLFFAYIQRCRPSRVFFFFPKLNICKVIHLFNCCVRSGRLNLHNHSLYVPIFHPTIFDWCAIYYHLINLLPHEYFSWTYQV